MARVVPQTQADKVSEVFAERAVVGHGGRRGVSDAVEDRPEAAGRVYGQAPQRERQEGQPERPNVGGVAVVLPVDPLRSLD